MTEKLTKCHARFKAKYLHAVRRILDRAREMQFLRGTVGLFVEPMPQGCLLIATNGHAIAIIHDASGFANKPFRMLLPKAFVERAAPPKPLQVFIEGPDEIEWPEWAQPGDVFITPICALIFGAMHHPDVEDLEYAPALANVVVSNGNEWRDDDFRLFEDKTIPWRKAISQARGAQGRVCIDPDLMSVFAPLADLGGHLSQVGQFSLDFASSDDGPIIVRNRNAPEFYGAIMPLKAFDAEPTPEWVTATPAPKSNEPAQ
jgi:hypothetical protein